MKIINVEKIPEKYDLQGIFNDFMVNVIKRTMHLIENACKGIQCLDEKIGKSFIALKISLSNSCNIIPPPICLCEYFYLLIVMIVT